MEYLSDYKTFLQKSPSPQHTLSFARNLLKKKKFEELDPKDFGKNLPKKSFYMKDNLAIVAIDKSGTEKSTIIAANYNFGTSHIIFLSDYVYKQFNAIKVDSLPKLHPGYYVAGQVFYENETGKIVTKYFDSIDPICTIVDDNIVVSIVGEPTFTEYICSKLLIDASSLKSWDLGLFPKVTAYQFSTNNELFSANQNAQLFGVYSTLKTFVESKNKKLVNIMLIYNGNNTNMNEINDLLDSIIPMELKDIIKQSYCVCIDHYPVKNPNLSAQIFNENLIGKGISLIYDENTICTEDHPILAATSHLGMSCQKVSTNLANFEHFALRNHSTVCIPELICQNCSVIALRDMTDLMSLLFYMLEK